ncbi:hypothetical protein [Halomonas sp. BMC6]|uniref:hypothetical protein n=1 Tax=Halomonas sp. BMC6 TaxID=3073244 RepID=UPI0030D594F0
MSAEQDLANANVQIANLISEVTRFRDAAMGLNAIYSTITEGRQAVADGKYFSVPGGGAYMRLYRRQGSSAELIAEFPDRAQVQSLVDTLGGRGVVGGSGALMAQGAFGLGLANQTHENTSFGEAFSTSSPSQFFNFANSDFSEIGLSDNSYGGVLVNRGTRPLALLFPNSPRLFMSHRNSSEWSPATEFITTGNMVGAVSQSGGAPTGAVIERGSNANGEYTKFADGTVIMSTIANEVTLDANSTSSPTLDLPTVTLSTYESGFTYAQNASGSSVITSEGRARCESNLTATVRLRNHISTASTSGIIVTHIGRWY